MIHVPDWKAEFEWYQSAFTDAIEVAPLSDEFGMLEYKGVTIEIVPGDEKIASGPFGSVVYWTVENFDVSLEHFLSIGARLYRGPIDIENQTKMCQVLDPWGNCLGLRGRTETGVV